VRLGLAVAPGSLPGLRRAIEIASACWGGATFPILECNDLDEATNNCVALGVDAVLACDDGERCIELSERDGFSWYGLRGTPFKEEHSDRLVDLATILVAIRRERSGATPRLVGWEPSDPHADLLSVLFGRLGEATPYEVSLKQRVEDSVPHRSVGLGEKVPDDLDWLDGPLQLGMWNVTALNQFRETGVVIIDPAAPSDLIAFWNLRAIGNLVVPWPLPAPSRLDDFIKRALRALPRQRWGEDSQSRLSVFTSLDHVPEQLVEILDLTENEELIRSFMNLAGHTHVAAGIGTSFHSTFDVSVSGSPGTGESIRVPLPRTDLVPDQRAWDPWQQCAARITIHSELDLSERTSFRAPGIRPLVPALRWAMNLASPIVRGVGDGAVVTCRVTDNDVDIGILDSTYLVARLMEAAELEVRTSDAGLWMARIIDSLGGAASNLGSQPAVRQVLDRSARAAGASPKELKSEAAKAAGAWREHNRLWSRGRSYEEWVLGTLAARRVIEPTFSYRCPACGLAQLITPDRITTLLRCDDCEIETPLALQVILKGDWRLTTRRLFDQRRLRATFPLLATLRLLLDLSRDQDTLHYALGLEFSKAGHLCEIDFAVIVNDDRGPLLVLGESKARNDIEAGDVDNLEFAQEAVRSLGVECFIALASSKEQLNAEEVARLRAAADRFLWGIEGRRGYSSYVNLPIVLTRSSLTVPTDHPDHPVKAISVHRAGIAELAEWTCRRELGLGGIGEPGRWELEWSDPSPTNG
jgi:hypothetical protein